LTSLITPMMRSLSSCFDPTLMWRRTEGANLEKKPSMRLSHELYHHVRKGQSGQDEYTIEDGRGAVTLRDAVRSARVANVMSGDEARDSGIETRLRRRYFRIDYGKAIGTLAECSRFQARTLKRQRGMQ
jgi:hypothetical protein